MLNVPAPGDTAMTIVGSAATAGSTVDMTLSLAPNDYYAVVVDFAGVPTRYSICIGISTVIPLNQACQTLPASSVTALSQAQLQTSAARRARLEALIRKGGPRSVPLRPGSSLR
ncbi:MAG: hypothetical protein DMD65_11445 [Gemmatimonadetes bacterium]|nr:MAG: hypothetical protein DMD65_11445 [Gemmatimonadota bacterium]